MAEGITDLDMNSFDEAIGSQILQCLSIFGQSGVDRAR